MVYNGYIKAANTNRTEHTMNQIDINRAASKIISDLRADGYENSDDADGEITMMIEDIAPDAETYDRIYEALTAKF